MTLHAPFHRRRHELLLRVGCVAREGEEHDHGNRRSQDLFLSVDYPDDTVLRLDPMVDQNTGETQIGVAAGEPRSDDQVVEHDGEAVLHIAGLLSQALDGSTLDAVDTPQGPGIGITTPDSTPLTDDS